MQAENYQVLLCQLSL